MGAWEGIPIDRMEPAQKQTFELGRLIAFFPFGESMGGVGAAQVRAS